MPANAAVISRSGLNGAIVEAPVAHKNGVGTPT